MDITVFTEVHNGYGKFLMRWLASVILQEVSPAEILVILGKNHGANIEYLQKMNITYFEVDSDVIGELRNVAVENIKTSWMLYFSADDILLPNAIYEIKNKKNKYDAVALKYYNDSDEFNRIKTSAYFTTIKDAINWNKTNLPGYIAVKTKINNKILKYEPIEIPNYPYLFDLFKNTTNVISTDVPCAKYLKRNDGHGRTSHANGRYNEFCKTINEHLTNKLRKQIKEYGRIETLKSRGFKTLKQVREYINSTGFKNLSVEEQEDILRWKKKL